MKLGSFLQLPGLTRRHGVWGTARAAWNRRRRRFRRIILFGLTRPGTVPGPGAAHVLTFRFASAEEAAAMGGMDPAETAQALGSGDRCLLQFDRGKLVGYTWVAVSPLVFLTEGLHLPLPADAAYLYNTHTIPEYRGAGLQAIRTLELHRRLGPEGRHRLLCYVDELNLGGLKGVSKAGYRPAGKVTFHFEESHVRTEVRLDREWWSDARRL